MLKSEREGLARGMSMVSAKDCVLGTHDEEIERLGLQHRAWRERAPDAWRSAGIGPAQTCWMSVVARDMLHLDLAELVGPAGRVVAIDKSERFLGVLDAACRERRFENITTKAPDLDAGEFPPVVADRAWCRCRFRPASPPDSGADGRVTRTRRSHRAARVL